MLSMTSIYGEIDKSFKVLGELKEDSFMIK
jgi:hypothetical protein